VPTGVEDVQAAPLILDYRVHSVYPNPFNATAKIMFDLAEAGHVTLQVYNIAGQKVRTLVDGPYKAGRHAHVFQATNLARGTYILRLDANGQVHSRKLILVK